MHGRWLQGRPSLCQGLDQGSQVRPDSVTSTPGPSTNSPYKLVKSEGFFFTLREDVTKSRGLNNYIKLINDIILGTSILSKNFPQESVFLNLPRSPAGTLWVWILGQPNFDLVKEVLTGVKRHNVKTDFAYWLYLLVLDKKIDMAATRPRSWMTMQVNYQFSQNIMTVLRNDMYERW